MGNDDTTTRTPLSVLADHYETIKLQVAVSLRPRQAASRFGGTPQPDTSKVTLGKQDARRIAAQQLDAEVSHTTLEKILWLRQVGFDMERRATLRSTALDALEAIDNGDPVNGHYDLVHTLVLIDDLDQAAVNAPAHSAVAVIAGRQLKLLRNHNPYMVTPAMKRQARQQLADARETDRQLEAFIACHKTELYELEKVFKRRKREEHARYIQQAQEHLQARTTTPPGGANP